MTLDRKIVEANDQFLAAAGYSREELKGMDYMLLVRPQDQKDVDYQKVWADLAKGQSTQFIRPRLNKAGEERWFDVSYLPVLEAGGKPHQVLVVASDITAMHLRRRDNRSKVDALSRTMAVIEFDLKGTILAANSHFLDATGYRLDEIVGKHHRMFMPPGEADRPDYAKFWNDLGAGASFSGQVRRRTKSGEICWLEATYETLLDPEGCPFKVVKYAFDITANKNREAECDAKLASIEMVQAVIEFDAQGKILRANDRFCQTMGYSEAEILGKQHVMFVDEAYARSPDYAKFWEDLRAGVPQAREFKRIGKNGRVVFIEASYNPIRDASGRVVKVVKFAVDTTIFQTALTEVGAALDRVSQGDLRAEITTDLGPLEKLRIAFNGTISKLRDIIGSVAANASDLGQEAQAIAAGSTELSRRTEMQAATLEQSAAALEELSGSISGTTELTHSARAEIEETAREAKTSAEIVDQTVQAMTAIAEASRQISSIAGVIDDIAFQTNLLALNAGVEAARAGEAGRGFAVVASEVRALAQNSAGAAREISGLLVASEKRVAEGVTMVNRAGGALQNIMQRVDSVTGKMEAISSAASEQANGVKEMNNAVADLDRTTQQNAAMAEETNAAILTLNQRVEEVLQEVAFFDGAQGQPQPSRDNASMFVRQTGAQALRLDRKRSVEASLDHERARGSRIAN
ncbi:methyl-accepting chemotaxis protein [Frigidibacter sp. MR17.24]|uniref:methyl-accepting chemotaxis protein n=1 Tax=Frigidibacter sp. MR17.24 TaxID=3127345 RepID=UPI003012B051